MTKIQWDVDGSRIYEAGLSRGVLYLEDGSGVPWNGLISVAEKLDGDSAQPLYYNGAKLVDYTVRDDYSATMTVFTYPDEFLDYDGYASLGGGLYAKNQSPKRFGLCYRTEIGNDIDGYGHGYKLHVVYNLTAIADATDFETMGDKTSPMDFGWDISATPEPVTGYRSTAHLIIDSRSINKTLLSNLEDILYGSATTAPRLPRLEELRDYVQTWELISITDNGDGSWTATGPEEYFAMLSPEQFEIHGITGAFLDATTYTISTTYLMED